MIKKLILICLCLMIGSGCSLDRGSGSSELISRTGFVLGTVVTVKLLENGSEELLDQAFMRLQQIDALMSSNEEDSDIAKLNRQFEVRVSPDTFKVIEAAIEYGDISEGRFDITLGPVINLWRIGTEEANVPDKLAIEEMLRHVDYTKIQLLDNYTVRIPEGSSIDLGGIAKGYAADELSKILIDGGVTKAIINLGGNIKVIGNKSEDKPFNIGIQSPDENRNDYLGIIEAADKTIVTSGDYERYFIEDGIRYHHIFDAKTGYPYTTEVAAVTVVCENSMEADALSTILFMMPIHEGLEFVGTLDGVDCIYITKDMNLFFSSENLRHQFTLTDFDYSIE